MGERDFLDFVIAERTARNPAFRGLGGGCRGAPQDAPGSLRGNFREGARALHADLRMVADWAAEELDEPPAVLEPDRVAVVAVQPEVAVDEEVPDPRVPPWPLGDLADLGDPVADWPATRCLVVTGADLDAVLEAARKAHRETGGRPAAAPTSCGSARCCPTRRGVRTSPASAAGRSGGGGRIRLTIGGRSGRFRSSCAWRSVAGRVSWRSLS